MRKSMTLDDILEAAGIKATDTGLYVDEFKAVFAKKMSEGLQGVHWSFGPDAFKMSADDRARNLLAYDWAITRGHTYPVTHEFDSACPWWHLRHHAKRIFTDFKVWRDKNKNPYLRN